MKPSGPIHPSLILKKYGLRANKRMGQNFLCDPAALERIVAAGDFDQTDTVLEIGPGLGHLTAFLSQAVRTVIAVELDRGLVRVLQDLFALQSNVRIVQGDILELEPAELGLPALYVVAANIPYNITSSILRHLLETEPRPKRIVLTLQKEVAERLCASPPDMSMLALSVQVYGMPQLVAHIPAGAFYPPPKVDSAVVRIDLFSTPRIEVPLLGTFFSLTRAGFSQRRKTLRNALAAGLPLAVEAAASLLESSGIDSRRRAETLDLMEWERLTVRYARGNDSIKSAQTGRV